MPTDGQLAATRRRLIVTTTQSFTYDPAQVEAMWNALIGLGLIDFVRGLEDEDEEQRAMTMYEWMGDSRVELFLEVQDYDTGYEVEDYDPEA